MKRYDSPRQAVMAIPGIGDEEAEEVSRRAVELCVSYLPRATGAAAAGLIQFSTAGVRRAYINSTAVYVNRLRSIGATDLELHANGAFIKTTNWTQPLVPVGTGFTMTLNASGIWCANTSRRDQKEEITPFESSGDVIDALQPVTFIWKANINGDFGYSEDAERFRKADVQIGFVAEDVAEVDPRLAVWDIVKDEDGNPTDEMSPASWEERPMIALLVAEVQALRERVNELEKELQ